MNNILLQILLTLATAGFASTGFWAYIQRKGTSRTEMDKLLLGLAYDKIVSMGMAFIERGWITRDEYEDYRKYLYDPYKALGGNGVTERIMAAVSNLPLMSRAKYATLISDIQARGKTEGTNYADLDNAIVAEVLVD